MDPKLRITAFAFLFIALGFGVHAFAQIEFPIGFEAYFQKSYYSQFGPLAVSIELLIASLYLFAQHTKANFTLALFGFTVLLDLIFNWLGFYESSFPIISRIIFVLCALYSLYLAFTNTFKLGKISNIGALISLILASAIELFFNNW